MKASIACFFFALISSLALAQPVERLSIQDCYTLAARYYPLTRQRVLIAQSVQYSLDNISKGFLPQVAFGGQATYQSDVTKIPVKLPNINIEDPSHDQYKVFAEVNQLVYDGGVLKQQKRIQELNARVEEQNLETELYQLRERINQLFFGVLLIDAQLAQVQTLQKDINSGISKVAGAVINGAALKSNLDVLKAELLKTNQRAIELKAGRKAYMNMLGLFTHQTLDEATALETPASKQLTEKIRRPELRLFDFRQNVFDARQKLLSAQNLPRVGIFVQGGYGRPALNMLSNRFDLYSIGGIKVSWPLAGLYTARNDKRSLEVAKTSIDVQRETFLFNTNLAIEQQRADREKLASLIEVDREIMLVRASVKTAANAQLQYGTITASDYIREINAEDLAKQALLLHELQLIMVEYSNLVTTGND